MNPPLSLIAVSALALTCAACGPKTPPARAALECPPTQGDLTRASAAADGKSCTYAASDGAEVTLRLVPVTGGLDSTLSGIETALLAQRVAPAKTVEAPDASGAKTRAQADGDAEKAVREATEDAAPGDEVEIAANDSPHGVASRGGETTVNLPGIHIVANDADDSANVRVGPITVNAGGDNATIRIRRDVRLRGEALNPEKRGVRATFIYTGSDLPQGYRYVGYEAGGPRSGPITVAVVKSKSDRPGGGELYNGVKRLVRKNGGV